MIFKWKRIFDRRLVPQNYLNKGTIFWGRPIGNFPEFMPLDNYLNQDIIMSHRYHCAVTYHLHVDNNQKVSLRTPQLIARGIKRIMEVEIGVLSPSCIQQDYRLVITNMAVVYHTNGKMVLGLENRNGHRADKAGSNKWG